MGTLSDQEIIELGRAGALITQEFERDNVQQACYELRAGRVFYEPDKGNRRQTVIEGSDFLIKPKQLIVIITMESLELPADMLGRVLLKGRLFSLGLMPVNTYADPGFSGRLGIVLFNSAVAYVLFSLILVALTQTSTSRQLSVFTAIGLGVLANAVTSILTFAATRLRRRRKMRGPAPPS
jgi:deoxycytidine triphosphate deaminase